MDLFTFVIFSSPHFFSFSPNYFVWYCIVLDAKPTPEEAEVYQFITDVMKPGPALLENLRNYKGCSEQIRKVKFLFLFFFFSRLSTVFSFLQYLFFFRFLILFFFVGYINAWS